MATTPEDLRHVLDRLTGLEILALEYQVAEELDAGRPDLAKVTITSLIEETKRLAVDIRRILG